MSHTGSANLCFYDAQLHLSFLRIPKWQAPVQHLPSFHLVPGLNASHQKYNDKKEGDPVSRSVQSAVLQTLLTVIGVVSDFQDYCIPSSWSETHLRDYRNLGKREAKGGEKEEREWEWWW